MVFASHSEFADVKPFSLQFRHDDVEMCMEALSAPTFISPSAESKKLSRRASLGHY